MPGAEIASNKVMGVGPTANKGMGAGKTFKKSVGWCEIKLKAWWEGPSLNEYMGVGTNANKGMVGMAKPK